MKPMPLKYRLRAWWEGYDISELGRILSRRAAEAEPALREPAERPAGRTQRTAGAIVSKKRDAEGWSAARIAASQIVWGENSLSPRGEALLKSTATRLGLGQRSRILHLGAELGGTGHLLEQGLGCKVLCAETLTELLGAGDGTTRPLAAGDEPLLPGVDFILVDGLAERAEPLATILREQSSGLGPGGTMMLRALVMTDERNATSVRFRTWAENEPVRPRLRSSDELSRILQEARLSVTASASASQEYADEVERCWGDALDRIRALHRDPVGRALIPTLLDEGERWLRRIELIREGVLGVRHFSAVRRDRSRR